MPIGIAADSQKTEKTNPDGKNYRKNFLRSKFLGKFDCRPDYRQKQADHRQIEPVLIQKPVYGHGDVGCRREAAKKPKYPKNGDRALFSTRDCENDKAGKNETAEDN